MENKQMIGTAISMLKGIDPNTIEVINFDRTAYDDGSVGFSVNITTPATHKGSPMGDPIEQNGAYREMDKLADFILKEFPQEPGRDGRNESAADVAIRLLEKLIPNPVDELIATEFKRDFDGEIEQTYDFPQRARWVVLDLGEPAKQYVPDKRTLKVSGPVNEIYQTDKV